MFCKFCLLLNTPMRQQDFTLFYGALSILRLKIIDPIQQNRYPNKVQLANSNLFDH